jgi:uncharacterized membrane protein required for colicin V production
MNVTSHLNLLFEIVTDPQTSTYCTFTVIFVDHILIWGVYLYIYLCTYILGVCNYIDFKNMEIIQ